MLFINVLIYLSVRPGSYIYIETSRPRKVGDTARFDSFAIKGNSQNCRVNTLASEETFYLCVNNMNLFQNIDTVFLEGAVISFCVLIFIVKMNFNKTRLKGNRPKEKQIEFHFSL